MNEKEIAELRRRLRPDRSGISHVRGCYVNEKGEIISQFDQSLGVMTQEESEKLLALLKRTLSGTLEKNLLNLVFSTRQAAGSPEHRRLMDLRASQLKGEAVQDMFQTIIQSLRLEGNYMILLAHDAYDVPSRGGDGALQEDASEVFSYLLCAVCPVKRTKPALSFSVQEGEFHTKAADWVVAPPELGFLFPAFDGRSANVYGALYYTRDIQESREELIQAVFGMQPPMPAALQQESFQSVLEEALEEECSLPVVQAVHGQLCGLIEDHRDSREPEPLEVGKAEVRQALEARGVSQAHIQAFERRYDETFGTDAQLSPKNLVDPKKIQLKTADVHIQVSPDRSDLIQTRILDGVKYILIRVEEGVEVNGVPVQISE